MPEVPADSDPAVAHVAPFHAELGLSAPTAPMAPIDDFEAKLEACLKTRASVLSFTFGLLPDAAVAETKRRGLMLIGTATTVEEGLRLQASGVDAVVAQGSEAGGHRGTFLAFLASPISLSHARTRVLTRGATSGLHRNGG